MGVPLTDREQQVIRLLKEKGLSNKEIAVELDISWKTAAMHVHSIMEKTGAQNRTQVALLNIM